METKVSDCYFHGPEPISGSTTYEVCFECGHVWTKWRLRVATVKGCRSLSSALRWATQRDFYFCPLCVHDF